MRIAVVGSGVSGLVAAWLLQRRHTVTLFEAGGKVGGHVHTVPVVDAGQRLAVDMGFIVYNERTYPLFSRLLRELDVATAESCMSFSVRSDSSRLEYNGSTLGQLFAQRRNVLRPSFYRMVTGILRFNRSAARLVESGDREMTLAEFLCREKLTGPFLEHYLLPMTAAIWSMSPADVLDFPAVTLARFLDNHGMLSLDDRPRWRVVAGGSERYVERLIRDFTGAVCLRSPISRLHRRPDGVELEVAGELRRFDSVVVATHSDQALRMLADPSEAEREVLAAIPYRNNRVTLHRDPVLMPRRRRAWASWNYHLETGDRAPRLTYWMNRLQSLDTDRPLLVTLNSDGQLDPGTMEHQVDLAHPQFGAGSEAAKARWGEISRGRTFYCGAYWFNGFHEDGVRSAVRVAEALGVSWHGPARQDQAA